MEGCLLVELLLAAALHGSAERPMQYAEVAACLLEAAVSQGGAARYAEHLSDRIVARLAGSAGEKAAVAWAIGEIRSLGLEPRTEPVMVPV